MAHLRHAHDEGECFKALMTQTRIVQKLQVPLIQSILLAAWEGDNANPAGRARGWVSAHALAPLLARCNEAAVETVSTIISLTGRSQASDVASVKSALEAAYYCMDISCTDIDGLIGGDGKFVDGLGPCEDIGDEDEQDQQMTLLESAPEDHNSNQAAVIAFLAVFLVLVSLLACCTTWQCLRWRSLAKDGERRPFTDNYGPSAGVVMGNSLRAAASDA